MSPRGRSFVLLSADLERPYFDFVLNAWVFTRYSDVTAAFRSESLYPVGLRTKPGAAIPDDQARHNMRLETASALSRLALERWQDEIVLVGSGLLDNILHDSSADLMDQYARPLCQHLAGSVTGCVTSRGSRVTQLASFVSAAAAEPFDRRLGWRAKRAGKQLAEYFHSGPDPLRASGFVAISQTLPCLLGKIWLSLIQQPTEWSRSNQGLNLTGSAVDELLRHSGLTQNLFRVASADCNLNGTNVIRGERILLKIDCANRDPKQFNAPESIDLLAKRKPHLALGFGSHACVAAPLLRMIIGASTRLLTQRLPSLSLANDITWSGGSGFRFPRSLDVKWKAIGIGP